tara:strand:+ start:3379 stop:4218 length:840 start_codon:yes stop_codon:yes gene_type:complete
MIVRDILKYCEKQLSDHQKDSATIEAHVVVGHVLKKSRSDLLRDQDVELSEYQQSEIFRVIHERISGNPLSYITGHRDFYGLSFTVNRNVLIPRQETELLIETVMRWICIEHLRLNIVDVGTGSGCLAVALAVNVEKADITAIDISKEALSVAAQNCRYHSVNNRVQLRQGSLLSGFVGIADVIVANLPYIKKNEINHLQQEIMYEPIQALDGGLDGLHFQRELLHQSRSKLSSSGILAMEISPEQGSALEDLAKEIFPLREVRLLRDLNGHERVLCIK